MVIKTQLERLRKKQVQCLHINQRLLNAVAEEVLESKERNRQASSSSSSQDEEEQVSSSSFLPSSTALLEILCSAMHSSSSTLREVWITDDMILLDQSKSDSSDDDRSNKDQEEGGGQHLLLHTLTTLPRLERLRFYISASITKSESELFMQLVAPTIRSCKRLQSLHFCMSNSSLPPPAPEQGDAAVGETVRAPLIPTGCCFTPTALHTLAKIGLENHASLTEFGLQDVVIVGHEQSSSSSACQARRRLVSEQPPSTGSLPSPVQFPLDPVLRALASLPQLETVDISLSKQVPQSPRRRRGETSRPEPAVTKTKTKTSTTTRRPCFFSARALAALFSSAKLLQDVTLWDVGLQDHHLDHVLPALQHHESLQFLSLRGNPGISRAGWSRFHRDMLLLHNFTLRSLFHDGGFGDDLEKAMDLVLYWNMLGRGRLFAATNSTPHLHNNKNSSRNGAVVDDWIDMLETVNDDLSSLYYFVRQGNALLMPSSAPSTSS